MQTRKASSSPSTLFLHPQALDDLLTTAPPKPPSPLDLGFSDGQFDDGFIDARQFAKLLNIRRASFYRAKSKRLLPRETRLGQRCVRWLLSEVQCWMRFGCPEQDRWDQMRGSFGFGPESGK